MVRALVVFVTILFLTGTSDNAPPAQKCISRVEAHGSLPPLPSMYECVRELNGNSYDSDAAKVCLDKILASGYLEGGHLEVKQGNTKTSVRFVLTAPSLLVKNVDFKISDSMKKPMLDWISRFGEIVRPQEAYDSVRDDRTVQILDFYFRAIGKAAGITRNVTLNYPDRSAQLTYEITVGPDIVPTRALPPYSKECEERIAMFNATDVDDYVPMDLVEQMTKIHGFGCFTSTGISEDTKALLDSKLFSDVRYDVEGKGTDKQIALHLKGKPITVEGIRITGYGLLADHAFTPQPTLPLKVGGSYSQSSARGAQDYLKEKYAAPNENIEVTERDQMTGDNQMIVTFDLIAYMQDRVTINGREFYVAPFTSTFSLAVQ
jgi:hypothetical protein